MLPECPEIGGPREAYVGLMGATLKEGLVFRREEAQQRSGRPAFSAWKSELGSALEVCTVSKDPLSRDQWRQEL